MKKRGKRWENKVKYHADTAILILRKIQQIWYENFHPILAFVISFSAFFSHSFFAIFDVFFGLEKLLSFLEVLVNELYNSLQNEALRSTGEFIMDLVSHWRNPIRYIPTFHTLFIVYKYPKFCCTHFLNPPLFFHCWIQFLNNNSDNNSNNVINICRRNDWWNGRKKIVKIVQFSLGRCISLRISALQLDIFRQKIVFFSFFLSID